MLRLDEKLLEEIEKDIDSFVGKTIDISESPDILSSHLNPNLARWFEVTQQQLSVQVAEDHIRKLALKKDIEVVCFSKEQIEKETDLLEQMQPGRIILFK